MEGGQENFIKKSSYIATGLFVIFSVWMLFIVFVDLGPDSHTAQIWASSYQLVAWFGAICGLFFSKLWGGWKSQIGRASLAFAIGLLAQSFGQSVFSYYYYSGIEAPYPSIADIGFFGSIPIYIYAIYLLAKASGASVTLQSITNKLIAVLIPLALLALSYYVFLKDYEIDFTNPLVPFLDFGYPLGQAVFLSIAILAYLLTKNYLGGLMRGPIIAFIVALFVQYAADYLFLYQVSREIYVGGLEVDYLYLLAYFTMTYSLIKLGSTFYKIKNS